MSSICENISLEIMKIVDFVVNLHITSIKLIYEMEVVTDNKMINH